MPPKKKESEEDVDRLTRIAMYVLLGRRLALPPPPPTLPRLTNTPTGLAFRRRAYV
jgi:hypothetical protein